MSIKNIANLIPTVQAASLVNENLKNVKKKKTSGDMMEMGMKNIVGINLIKIESDLIAGL